MTQPGIKKDSQGRWVITGVQENTDISQVQQDYNDLLKASQLVPGDTGAQARKILQFAPKLSGGVLSSLVANGAVPNNDLVKTLEQIDAQTRAQREMDAFKEQQKIATEKFNNSIKGKIWTAIKGASRGVALVANTPFELVGTAVREVKQSFDAWRRGEIDFWTGNPTDPTKTRADLGLPSGVLQKVTSGQDITAPEKVLGQITAYQTAKEFLDSGNIDLGAGFFPSEQTGAAFVARQRALESAKIAYKQDGQTVYRPYSLFDPVTTVITGGKADTATGGVITAVGDLLFMIATDPFLAHGRLKAAKEAADRVARMSEGVKAATAARDASLLGAKLDEAVANTTKAIDELRAMAGKPGAKLKEKEVQKLLDEQLKIADEFDNLSYDPEKIANFLTASYAGPAIDALAQEDDWFKIYQLGKRGGKRGGFTVEQSKAIAAAKDRDSVLRTLAPFVADGQVVGDVLESGTKMGRFVKGVGEELSTTVNKIGDKIIPGRAIEVANTVRGLAADGIKKLPYIDKVTQTTSKFVNGTKEVLSRKYNTILPVGGQLVHSSDKDALIQNIMAYGRATNVAEPVLRKLIDTVAYADNTSEAGYTASGKLFNEIFKANSELFRVDKKALEDVTRVFEGGRNKMSSYWAERHAAGAKLDYVMNNGKKYTISGPHLDSEYLNSMVYFPPVDEVLNTISGLNRYAKVGRLREGLDVFTNSIWKRMVLVRPAYVIRNIAEEQIRVLGTGHISFFNNPIMATAMWLGRDTGPAWRRLLNKFDPYKHTVMGTNFKLASAEEEFAAEVLAHDAKESYLSFMADRAVSSIDNDVRTSMQFAGFESKDFGHPRWWEGLANEIRILSNSIAGRAVARTAPGKEAATIDFLLRGGGKDEWNKFARLQNPDVRDWLLSNEGAMSYLFTGKDSAGRMTSVLARIEEAAGKGGEASTAIKNLISFGRFESPDIKITVPKGKASAENSIKNSKEMSAGRKEIKDANQEFADILKANFDGKGNWDGIRMNVPVQKFGKAKRDKSILLNISDSFFDIAVKFEKTSTMGPEWRQKYWDAITDISKALDADAVSNLKKIAPDSLTPLKSWNGKPIGQSHGAWKALENATGDGNITAQMAHEYASTIASKHVADLFYDASRKRLLFHQLRLILPFGQAWEDTIHAWSKIALDNPLQTYKISKGLDWLQSPESSALYQLTDARDYYDPNQGFFFNDPLDGQRKFYVPYMSTGLNFLSNMFVGRQSFQGPYAAAATPQSFNFAFSSGSIIPGVGPVMAIAVTALDKFGLNPLKLLPVGLRESVYKIIYPFGEPDFKSGFVEAFIPGNWRRLLAPVLPEEAYAASFAPTMNYLASSGDYNLDDPTDQQKLITDTDTFAKWFTVYRGLFGLISPVPIQPTGLTTLKDGNTILSTALYNDFKKLEVSAGSDRNKAYADFMDLYGPDYIFAIISTSTGAPTNLYTFEKIKKDPSVTTDYADTYGYFYPGGGFSQELYRWQRRQGQKERYTPQELIDRATSIRYYAAKDRLLTRSAAEGWSNDQYQEALGALNDAYSVAGLKETFDANKNNRVMSQLRKAANDDRFNDSDAVAGLRDYLYLRDEALKAAGITTDNLAVKGTIEQRKWLAQQAKDIISRNPDFQGIFYTFFKKELQVD